MKIKARDIMIVVVIILIVIAIILSFSSAYESKKFDIQCKAQNGVSLHSRYSEQNGMCISNSVLLKIEK